MAPDPVLWPFPALRVVSGDLELRYLDDSTLDELAHLAADGVHAPDAMPFLVPWSRGTPSEVARRVLAFQWQTRGALASGEGPLRLELAVFHRGAPVGVQGFSGRDVPVVRTVETGSWLGRRHQGQGLGTRMRRVMLHLLFEGFGLTEATTTAFVDNAPSNGVTRRLGYTPEGTELVARDGSPVVVNRYRLTREAWLAQPGRPDVVMHGVEPVRSFLGL
ncbi:GNAT family N-acetyltransferase [Luteimicrobium subarcticum]|uniref:RimJ/RimL family protein N-acetyltransferase n=1 Tax=Luteimicrobium subarcticum TaxID=620910 RepID=A0A2M8W449_9MICO|nr:GNAT family protein [Luteimicrobium subarcticum]PJI85688.1 RimJ/RimL family protein N-acetyltransferase [Luteimicrobium subarcticum]